MKKYPETCIVSRSPSLKEKFKDYNILEPEDNDIIMDVLKIVTIPGHTMDSSAVLDMRTKTLISGDCLQLYGILGSGEWGASIKIPAEHIEAVDKLRLMDLDCILTAHDYQPCGYMYKGKEEIAYSLDCCIEPLIKVKNLIIENPNLDDAQICDIYNSSDSLPTLGKFVVTSIRESGKDEM